MKPIPWLASFQWPLLLLAAVGLLFPAPQRAGLLLAVPCLFLVGILAWRQPLPATPLNLPLLLLFVMVMVSAWSSYDLSISLPKLAGMALAGCVFIFVVQHGQRKGEWFLLLLAFAALATAVALLGLLGTHWFEKKFTALNGLIHLLPTRLQGLPGAQDGFQPNEVAGTLLWGIPIQVSIFLAFLWQKAPFRSRWLSVPTALCFGAFALLCGGVFLLAQSRGGYIALAVTLPGMALLALPDHGRRLALFGGSLFALTALYLVLHYFPALPVSALRSIQEGYNPAFSINSLNARVGIWASAVYAVRDFPLTGAGMNTFRYMGYYLYPLFISMGSSLGHAHNEFFQAALDLGLPGLIAFLSIYLISFWMLWQLFLKAERGQTFSLPLKAIVLGLGGGLFAHFLYGLTDAVALGAKPGFLIWMLLGLITALYMQCQLQEAAERAQCE